MNNKVLICDDTLFIRKLLAEILTSNGYDVVGEAENGRVAIEKFKELKPDVTLMDITMPELNGIKALEGIMASDSNARVVMCSTMGEKNVILGAIRQGARDFIVKPFNIQRVVEAIKRVVGN